jgi:hypothetical protein
MNGPATERVVRDMAITPGDFFRLLPRALDGLTYAAGRDHVAVGDAAHGVAISIRPLEPRRIALLVIERCEVVLAFKGYDAAERQTFLERFDRAYHRGGG